MISDASGNCEHRNFYSEDIKGTNKFYVRCGICNEIRDIITFGVNSLPKESYTRIISRREMERKRRPSTQSLEAVR